MDRNLPDDATDEQILEAACNTSGCLNYRMNGLTLCEDCMHGAATQLPYDLARRKLALDKEHEHD